MEEIQEQEEKQSGLQTDEQDSLKDEKEPECISSEEEKVNKKRSRKSVIRELIMDAAIILLCIFVVPKYVLQRTIVSGSSMEDTLHNDDNLLVEKLTYRISGPNRFDIIVFYPYGKDDGEYYVKRVIGLPGETVQIIGDDIYIDGEKLEENYGREPMIEAGMAAEPLTLGEDEYFVLGDNRTVSFDSRYEPVGPVHKDLIAGKAILRIWPFEDFGTVK